MSENFLRKSIYFGLVCSFLASINKLTVLDLDLFHEMSLIREALKMGTLPRYDIFSYLPTIYPVVHHEWGMGAIIYFLVVHLGFGAYGLMILKYLLTVLIAVGCYIMSFRRGASLYIFSFLAFFAIMLGMIGFTTIRAQVFTLLFLVILIFLIEEDRKNKKWALWAWLPLFIIWLNIHGGFLVGLGILAIYVFERFCMEYYVEKKLLSTIKKLKYQLLIFFLSCPLILINPYGIDYISYIWNAVTLDRSPYILEWRPIWVISIRTFLFYALSIIIVTYAMIQKKFKYEPGLLFLIATAWFALWHYRHVSIYSITWLCYSPAIIKHTKLGDLIERTYKNNQKMLTIIFLIIGAGSLVVSIQKKIWQLRIPTKIEDYYRNVPIYPAGAVKYLQHNKFVGNIMVPYEAGAYVSWCLYPRVKVSMDSRFEVAYHIEDVAQNINFYAAKKGWENTLNKYSTDAILIPRWSELDKIFDPDVQHIYPDFAKKWIQRYRDDGYTLYMRSSFKNKYPFVDMSGNQIIGTFP